MKKIYAFDFDGTLTTKDTLLEFIRFVFGIRRMLFGFLIYSPLLILMKLRLYSNYKAKEKIFTYFFRGMSEDEFNLHCENFAQSSRKLIRDNAVNYINALLKSDIYIVSASIDNWVKPFCRYFNKDITVLGTQIEIENGMVTGKFKTPNCYGKEKVKRLSEFISDRKDCFVCAFGDSRGDKEMLMYADESHYKPFRDE